CSRWSSCCWVWRPYHRRTMPPTRSRSRSVTRTRNGPRRPASCRRRPAAARPPPAGGTTVPDANGPVIAHLHGRIFEKHPNRVVVEVSGVGYDVAVPLSTFYGLGDVGSEIGLRIHTHVREDALLLYGFATRLEQQLFERLIGVSGIGPKV